MKIKAIKNYYEDGNKFLTKYKVYASYTLYNDSLFYWLIDDRGSEWIYHKDLFEIVEEYI